MPVVCLPLVALAFVGGRWPFDSLAFHEFWEIVCLGVSLAGLGVRIVAVGHAPGGTSGRNTKSQSATVLNTTGLYATVRHPLYLGNYLIGLGVTLVPFVAWLPVIYTLAFWLYYERIMMAEEAFLAERFGEQFVAWAGRTSPFIPRLSQWTRPSVPFSLRSVLRREYTTLLLVVALHASTEEIEHLLIEHRLIFDPFWETLLTAAVAVYLLLRSLKKHSTLLDVAGR